MNIHAPGPRKALALLALPALWVGIGWGRCATPRTSDQAGHLWNYWNASTGQLGWTDRLYWPEGVDLVPYLGGWLDVALGAVLARVVPLPVAWNLTIAALVLLAGVGGWVLARELGARPPWALAAGLALQLDGFLLDHLVEGRLEVASLGLCALAVGLGLGAWREPGWGRMVGAGLAGGLVVVASWHLAIALAAGGLVVLGPHVVGERPPGALGRAVGVVAVAALVAVPWSVWFALHSVHTERFGAEELVAMRLIAGEASTGWLGALRPGAPRPATGVVLLALAGLPWAWWRPRWRTWLGLGLVALAGWIVAAGPTPDLWGSGGGWGPYELVLRLPVLRGFQWPERALVWLSLACAPAAALSLQALAARRGTRLAGWVGICVLVLALVEQGALHRLPRGGDPLAFPAALHELALAPAGVVVDLPLPDMQVATDQALLAQTVHGHPKLLGMRLHKRVEARRQELTDHHPLLQGAWRLQQSSGPARLGPGDLDSLRAAGVRYLAIHPEIADDPAPWWRLAREVERVAGPPRWRTPTWVCWEVGDP